MRSIRLIPCIPIAFLAAILSSGPLVGQTLGADRPTGARVAVLAEPLAAGLEVAWAGSRVRAGAALIAGPQFGVDVANAPDVRAWANAQLVLGFRPAPRFELFVSPIGAALVVGDDFGAVYPSAQAGAEFGAARMRFGSLFRIIRIAGGNGSGTYWTQWIPLRVSYSIGS